MTPDLLEHAKEALTRPSDYGYHGDNDKMFVTWGQSGPIRTRDSKALDNANYQAISKYMTKKYPDDIREMRNSHWAVGWAECFEVRVLTNDAPNFEPGLAQYDDLEEDDITECFKQLHEICVHLAEVYPVFDDDLYSQMELEECLDYLEFDASLTSKEAVEVHEILVDEFNHYCSDDSGWTQGELDQALLAVGLKECEFEWDMLTCSGDMASRETPDGLFICETCARSEGMEPVYPVIEGQLALANV